MKSKIVIAGGSGFIGQELADYFKDKFHIIVLT
ncbi:MAG: epimerase, partial [Bacteroidia bacterium]|nr:epimerase [Bacteroidia bacterium]